MKTKIINHNRIEKCRISKKVIDTETDRYSIILDCSGDEIYSIGFYKSEVLSDLIKGKGKIIQKSFIERQGQFINNILGSNPAIQNLFRNLNNQNKENKEEVVII